MKDLNERFEDVAPQCFIYEEGTNTSKAMSQKFRKTYFPYDIIDARSFEDLNHFFSDSLIGYPTHLFVNLASKFIDVYYYRFSYVGSFSLFLYPRKSPYSVGHGDDLHYLVPFYFFPVIEVDDPDNFMVERLLSVYANFASNGYESMAVKDVLEKSKSEPFFSLAIPTMQRTNIWLEWFGQCLMKTIHFTWILEDI